jgi:hypothetical protein
VVSCRLQLRRVVRVPHLYAYPNLPNFIRAGSFSFGLYCWPLGEAAAVGGALARHVEEAVDGALARHVEEAVDGALARRVEQAADGAPARRVEVREEPGVIGGPPVVVRVVSEPAAGLEVYVQPGAEEPEYAGPVAAAF